MIDQSRSRFVALWVFLAALVPAVAPVARGATTIGSLDATGYNASAGHLFFGQTFTVPAGETGLVSGTLLARNGMGGVRTGTLSVREWDPTASSLDRLGGVLASVPVSVPDGASQPIAGTFNLPVTPGEDYALILQWDGADPSAYDNAGGYFSNLGYYTGGSTLLASGTAGQSSEITGSDNAFQVSFGAVPEPTGLAMIPLGVLVLARRKVSR